MVFFKENVFFFFFLQIILEDIVKRLLQTIKTIKLLDVKREERRRISKEIDVNATKILNR